MKRRETVMTGDRYKLVRYDVNDNDELYPADGRVPRDIAEDLCMDPDEWVRVGSPWAGGASVMYWMSNDGELHGIFKL